jgi:type II secretory pathway component GspD/PulD (secretin)
MQDAFTRSISEIRTAVLSADDFNVVLSALKQTHGVDIISNPKIIVANEETATIHIGENEPNIKGSVTAGQQGQANTTTYALDDVKPYFEFGVSLEVTPTINNDSNITVKITPKLSRFVRDKIAPDNNTFPVEATKTIKTVFRLESGRTAAIGGLTETQKRENTTKIPLLGDIPLLGKYLFSYTHDQKVQQETIIFVTVGLANPDKIQKNDGLPEDADLVHRHLIQKELPKESGQGQGPSKSSPSAEPDVRPQ